MRTSSMWSVTAGTFPFAATPKVKAARPGSNGMSSGRSMVRADPERDLARRPTDDQRPPLVGDVVAVRDPARRDVVLCRVLDVQAEAGRVDGHADAPLLPVARAGLELGAEEADVVLLRRAEPFAAHVEASLEGHADRPGEAPLERALDRRDDAAGAPSTRAGTERRGGGDDVLRVHVQHEEVSGVRLVPARWGKRVERRLGEGRSAVHAVLRGGKGGGGCVASGGAAVGARVHARVCACIGGRRLVRSERSASGEQHDDGGDGRRTHSDRGYHARRLTRRGARA